MDLIAINRDLRRMLPLAVLVVGLHAALLAVPVRSARGDPALAPVGQMQVRLISSPAQALPAPSWEPYAERALAPTAAPATSPPAPPEAVAAIAAEVQPPAAPGAPASVSPPAPAFSLVAPAGDRDSDYFPRALLSQAPSPLEPVLIDYPPIANDRGRHVSELTLFIDEAGHVARVRVDGPALPPALEDAARRAFLGARFRPGQAEGRAVKAQIRVEVVFDNGAPGKP